MPLAARLVTGINSTSSANHENLSPKTNRKNTIFPGVLRTQEKNFRPLAAVAQASQRAKYPASLCAAAMRWTMQCAAISQRREPTDDTGVSIRPGLRPRQQGHERGTRAVGRTRPRASGGGRAAALCGGESNAVRGLTSWVSTPGTATLLARRLAALVIPAVWKGRIHPLELRRPRSAGQTAEVTSSRP